MHPRHLILLFGVASLLGVRATTTESSPQVEESALDVALMNATMQLLEYGNREIQLLGTHKDLTLLVGLSGSGKSTMAHFLGDQHLTLEAYDVDDDILIRDMHKKISDGNSSLTSKTLFPELILDHETGEAMYDCPGFKDTRNTSVEIANGFFIKQLVKHASSIKILVVAKYDAVKVGGSRGWFTSLVAQLLQFMRNVPNYKGAIALLVTKVDVRVNDQKALNRIVGFIKKAHAHSLEQFPDRKVDLNALFNSWMEQDSEGNYVNLDFFRQPEETGRLSDMSEVIANRQRLRQTVFSNAHFKHVRCDSSDFGIPLSGEAVADIQKIQLKLKDQINTGLDTLASGIRERVSSVEASSKDALLSPEIFAAILKGNARVEQVETVDGVLEEVASAATSMGVLAVNGTVKSLKDRFEYLNYLESLHSDEESKTKETIGEQLRKVMAETAETSELNIRSRLDAAIRAAFQNSKIAVQKEIKRRDEESKVEAVYAVAVATEDCSLNSLDFFKSAERILDLNKKFNFGLASGALEKVVKLVDLLPVGGKLAEMFKKEGLLDTLKSELEKVVVDVGREAGVTELFPRFGTDRKCPDSG